MRFPYLLATNSLALGKTPPWNATASISLQATSTGSEQPARSDLDTAMIDPLLGGEAVTSIYQSGIPRAETITDGGMEVPVAWGLAKGLHEALDRVDLAQS